MKKNSQFLSLIFAIFSSIFSIPLLVFPFSLTIFVKIAILVALILLPQLLLWIFSKKTKVKEQIETDFLENQKKAEEEQIIQNLENELSSHIKLEEESCKEIHNLALRSHIFSSVFKELCNSISNNLSSTTEPLSDELFKIKKDMSDFLHHVQQYEDEVKNHHMLNQVSNECSNIQTDMHTLDSNIREIFGDIETKVVDLQIVNDKIGDVAKSITEVSEKIRILSFNASIEAARAGKAGSGFRVIATEIKNLSALTENYLSQIWDTLKDTQGVFDTIRETIRGKAEGMFDVLAERQSGLKSFIVILQGYFKDFADLFDSVNEVIDSLSHSMDKVAPVVQLHEITSQEVGNMEMVIQDITQNIQDVYTGLPHAKPIYSDTIVLNEQAERISKEVRKRLTTESELKALKKGVTTIAPEAEIDLAITTKSIELF